MNNEEIIKDSYMTKTEFLTMITSIEFSHVKEFNIDLIKGFIAKKKEDSDSEVLIKPLYFNVRGD